MPHLLTMILKGWITLDALQIELHAGRISEEHQEQTIQALQAEKMETLNFLDFLVCLQEYFSALSHLNPLRYLKNVS